MNKTLSPNIRGVRRFALVGAGVCASVSLSAQQLFDFEADVEGWTPNNGMIEQTSEMPDHATSGSGVLAVVGGDSWFDAAQVVIPAGSEKHTAFLNADPSHSLIFDAIFDPDLDNGYRAAPSEADNPWFQVNAVVQSPGWQQFDKLMDSPWPDEVTVHQCVIPLASLTIEPESDITVRIIFNSAGANGYMVLLDNFRIGVAGDGPGDGDEWLGYTLDANGWADTGNWLGSVWATEAPWVWSDLGWIYVAEESHSESGAWIYRPKFE